MSLISKILNHYTNEAGKKEIHFIDDLGFEYTLAYDVDSVFNYFYGHPSGELSQVEQKNLYDYVKQISLGWIDPMFKRFVNASFMEWRAVVELEHVN
jgi:hypothetical protein